MGMALDDQSKAAFQFEAIRGIVALIFDEFEKANNWMDARNPLLGGISPRQMILLGKFEQLLEFVTDAYKENREYDRRRHL